MATEVRFYTDEHIGKGVIKGLRDRGADVLTTPEAGLLGAEDHEHLERALAEGRVLATQDKDYLRLHAAGVEHAGIAYAPQGTAVGDIVLGLMLIHQVFDADEMRGHVEFL